MGKKQPTNPNLRQVPITAGWSNPPPQIQRSAKQDAPVLSSNSKTSCQSLRNEMSRSSVPSSLSSNLLPSQTITPGGFLGLSNENRVFPGSSSSRESTSYPLNTPNAISKALNIEEFGSMDSDNEDDIIAPLIQKERILGGRVDKLKSVDESIDGVPVDDSKMLSSKYRPIESSKGLSRSTRTSDKSSSGSAYSAFPKDPQSNMRSFSQARKYPDLFKDEAKKTRNDQYLREPISSTVRNKFMRPGDEMEDIASRSRALKSTSSSTKGKFVRPDDSAAFELPRERKRDDRSLIRSADSKLARERESGRSPMSSRSISIEEASLRKLKERRDIDKKDSRPTKVADTDRRNTLRSDSKSDDNNRNREHFLKESRRSSKVSKKKEDIKAVKLSWHSTPVDRRKGESEVPQNEKASTSKNPLLRGLKQASKNTSQGKVTTVGNQRVPQPSKKGADELPETQNNSSPGSILPQQSFLQNAPPMGVPSDVLLPQDQASVQNLFMGLLNNFNNQGFMSNNMGMPGNFPAHPEQLFMQSGGVSALTNNHISPDQMFMQNSNNGLPPNIGLHPSAIQEALMQQEAFLIQSGLFQNAMQGVMPPAVAQSSQQASNTPTSHNFPQPGILDMRPPPTHGSAHQGLSSMQQPMTSMGGVGLQATPAPHELPSSALLNNPQSLHKTPSSRFNNPQKDCNLLTYPHSSLNRTPANQNLTHMSTEPSFLESPSIPPPTAPQVFRSGGGQTSDLSHVDEVMKKLAPDGTGSVKYPAPDTNLLLFDPEIGYRYDPGTGLHYDANSGYFFNSKMKVFLYWDLFTQTYLRVENPTIPFPNLQNKKESIDSNYKHSLQPSTDSSGTIIDMKKLIEQHRQIKLEQDRANRGNPRSGSRDRDRGMNSSRKRSASPTRINDPKIRQPRSRSPRPRSSSPKRVGRGNSPMSSKKQRWDDYSHVPPFSKRRSISPRNSNKARNDRRENGSPDNRRGPLRLSPLRRRSHSKSPLALHRKRSPSPGFNRRMDIRNRTRSPANGKKHLVSRSPQRKRARSKSPLGLSVKRSRSPSPGRRKNPINSGKRPGSRSPRRKTTNSRSPVRPFKKQSPSSGPSRRDKRSKSPKTTRADNRKRTGVTRRRSHSPRLVARRRDQFGTSRTLDEEDVSARPSLVVTVLNIPTEGVSIEKKSPERKLSIDESPGKNTEHTDGSRTIGSGLKGPVEKNDERTKDSKVCGGKNDKSEEKSKSSRRNSSRDRRNDPKKDDKKPSNKETNNKSSDKRPDKRDVEKNSETTKIAKQEEDSSTGEGRNHRLVSERQFSTGQTREVLVKGLTLSQEEISQSKPKPLSKFDAPSSVESKKLDAVLLVDLPGVPDDLSEFVILDEDEEESNDEMTEEALQLLLSNPSDKSVSSNAEDEPEQQGDNLCPIINSSASSVAAKNESPHSINKSADSSTDLEAVPVGTGYSGTSSCVHESDSQEKRISGDSKDEKIPQKVVDNNSQDKLVLQQISTYSEPPSPTNSIYSSYDFSDDEKYVTVSATQDEDGNEEKNYVDEGKDVSSKEIFSEGQNAEDVRIDESKIDETPLGSKSSNIDTKDVEIPKPSKATEKNNETEKQPEMNETFNSIVKTVGKNDELHQEAIVETTTEPIINEEVGERVDKFVKNNEPVTIQNDDAKKDSITTNQIPINDTDISKQVVQISSGTGQAGVESLTGCQRQENEKQIQGTEQDEGEIISGCHGQHNEKQIQGTGQDENVILTGSQEKQNVIQVEGTGLDEDKMLTDSLEKHNENEVHGTEQDENKIVIGSKEEQDEKQVQGTGQEEHTSSQEKQVLCTKQDEDKILAGSKEEQNEKQDQGTGQDENTSSQENQVQCTGEDENKILAGPKKEQNEKQVQGTGQDESKLHTSSLENLVQCTGQDENKILAGPKEEQNEKQVQGSGPDENTILAGSQEKQLQGSGHDEDKILTGSQSEKHVQGPGQDEDKILIGSKEEQNEKQLQGSGHDEDKILIGSKEEQNEKQAQGPGQDEDKILIGSKEEQNENQAQISGHDEHKIVTGSQEKQNKEQSLDAVHVEDIPDSEKFSEVARVDVSKKEPGTSQGRKVGNVFARLGGHASNSEKSASVPKISENRVGGDKDPMSDLYTSQPSTIVHLKSSRPNSDSRLLKESTFQNLCANNIDFVKISVCQKNNHGCPFEYIQVTLHSTAQAENWFQLTNRKVTLQHNATSTAEYYMYYAQPNWRCSYCSILNKFFRALCFSCFNHRSDPLAGVPFSETPSKYLGFGKIPTFARLDKVMFFTPGIFHQKVKRRKSLRVVVEPLMNCCSGIIIIEMLTVNDAVRVHNWARKTPKMSNQFVQYVELDKNSKLILYEVPPKPVKGVRTKPKTTPQQYNIHNRLEVDYELGVPRDCDEIDGSHDDVYVAHRIVDYNPGLESPQESNRDCPERYERDFSPPVHQERYRDRSMSPRQFSYRGSSPSSRRIVSPNRASSSRLYVDMDSHHHNQGRRSRSTSRHRSSLRYSSPSPRRFSPESRHAPRRRTPSPESRYSPRRRIPSPESRYRPYRRTSSPESRFAPRRRSPSPESRFAPRRRSPSPESRFAPRRRSPSPPSRSSNRPPRPDGTDTGWYYPPPDATTFQPETQTGLLYDPYTTLYYHPQSRLFYNGDLNIYLEYDLRSNRYIRVD